MTATQWLWRLFKFLPHKTEYSLQKRETRYIMILKLAFSTDTEASEIQ